MKLWLWHKEVKGDKDCIQTVWNVKVFRLRWILVLHFRSTVSFSTAEPTTEMLFWPKPEVPQQPFLKQDPCWRVKSSGPWCVIALWLVFPLNVLLISGRNKCLCLRPTNTFRTEPIWYFGTNQKLVFSFLPSGQNQATQFSTFPVLIGWFWSDV